MQRSVHWATLVDGRAEHVHDAAQSGLTHGHQDRLFGVGHHHAAAQAVRRTQSNGTDDAVAELLLNFQRQGGTFHLQRVINAGHLVTGKLNVDHRADTLNNLSLSQGVSLSHCLLQKFKSITKWTNAAA